jgi:hypothetical protein
MEIVATVDTSNMQRLAQHRLVWHLLGGIVHQT